MTVEADIFKDAETECPSKWIRGYFDAKGTDEKESFLKKLEEELKKKNGKSVDDYKMSYLDRMVYGDTLLDSAAARGDMVLAKLFIKYGADVNKLNSHDEPPLLRLCESKWSKHASAEMAEYLIDHGASLNATSNYSTTPVAPDETDPEIIATTLHTPLSLAVKRRNKELVKVLLDKGADMTHETVKFALAAACTGGYIGVVKMFLERGFPVNAMCYRKIEFKNIYTKVFCSTLLSANIREKGTSALVKLLLEHGADPNLVPSSGDVQSPLYDAVTAGRADICRLLVEHGAKLNHFTPLFPPTHISYLQLALDYFYRTLRGRKLLAASEKDNTPKNMNMMNQLVRNHGEIVELILCEGFAINDIFSLKELLQCLQYDTEETRRVLKTMFWVRRRNFVKVLHSASLLPMSKKPSIDSKKRKRGKTNPKANDDNKNVSSSSTDTASSPMEDVFYNLHREIASFL